VAVPVAGHAVSMQRNLDGLAQMSSLVGDDDEPQQADEVEAEMSPGGRRREPQRAEEAEEAATR
jgi:hypothetical protein